MRAESAPRVHAGSATFEFVVVAMVLVSLSSGVVGDGGGVASSLASGVAAAELDVFGFGLLFVFDSFGVRG